MTFPWSNGNFSDLLWIFWGLRQWCHRDCLSGFLPLRDGFSQTQDHHGILTIKIWQKIHLCQWISWRYTGGRVQTDPKMNYNTQQWRFKGGRYGKMTEHEVLNQWNSGFPMRHTPPGLGFSFTVYLYPKNVGFSEKSGTSKFQRLSRYPHKKS